MIVHGTIISPSPSCYSKSQLGNVLTSIQQNMEGWNLKPLWTLNISSSIKTSIHEHDWNVHYANKKDPQQDYSPNDNQKDGMFLANANCTTYDMDWNGENNHLKFPTWSVKFQTQSLS